MSALTEWLFSWDRNQRYMIYGGTAAVFVAAFIWFVYNPNELITEERTARLEELERKRSNLRRRVARYEDYKEQIKQLQLQLKLAVTKLPNEREIPDLLAKVSAVGRESGLEILLFRTKAENLKEFYAEVPVEMQMRGGYRQLAAFLERISKLNRVVNAIDISIKNPVVEAEDVGVDLACTAVTFRFLSEEERRRIEEREKRKKR